MNIARNPKKKRGRPQKEHSAYKDVAILAGSRHRADISRACRKLSAELLAEFGKKGPSWSESAILAYVARYPAEKQRAMWDILRPLGVRGAKRYVECLTRPPSVMQMMLRIMRFAEREFPSISWELVVQALRAATDEMVQHHELK